MSDTDREPPEQAHDVLAADEFAMPTVDPALHHGPVELPADPVDPLHAHDVLAAEDFAIPAGHEPPGPPAGAGRPDLRGPVLFTLAALLLLALGRRARRA